MVRLLLLNAKQRNNKLVWDETVRIINDLFSNVWGVEDVVTVNHATELTLPVRAISPSSGSPLDLNIRLPFLLSVPQASRERKSA